MESVSTSIMMSRIFNQPWRNICSEILNEIAYWVRPRLTSKKGVEAWLVDPDRPQRSVTIEDGERYSFVYSSRGNCVKMGIVGPFNREIELSLPQN